MANCTTCDNSTDEESLPLPAASSEVPSPAVPTPCTPTTVTKKVCCTTIKDQCSDCPPIPQPVAKLKLVTTIAMPGCNQTVEAIFDKDISELVPGLTLYARDSLAQTIRLVIVSVVPKNKLVLKNECSSCCPSSKPIGETIPADTLFSWGIPQCCGSSSVPTDPTTCLVGTFFFPAAGASAAANVANAYAYAIGGLYSLGGFVWKVAARVTSTQILLENPVPGNGSVVGGFLEGGTDGICIYPITPIADVDECNDSAVEEVVLTGCTPSGKRKLTSSLQCGIVTWDQIAGVFKVQALLGGSSITGPHYVQWDAANPCNSRLVSSPGLVGANCANTTCSLDLTPANTSNIYEIEVTTTAPFTTTAPNNIITLSGRQFNVLAIVVGGTPGKLRISPRFTVTVSETIPTGSEMCVVTGCQPFPSTDYTTPCALATYGQKVYCADDGLRTQPPAASGANTTAIISGDNIDIHAVGTYTQPEVTLGVGNPSACYSSVVTGTISMVATMQLDDDGTWALELLSGVDAAPVDVYPSLRPKSPSGEQTIVVQLVAHFSFVLTPGQTRTIRALPRIRTTNASANTGVSWTNNETRITYHATTV